MSIQDSVRGPELPTPATPDGYRLTISFADEKEGSEDTVYEFDSAPYVSTLGEYVIFSADGVQIGIGSDQVLGWLVEPISDEEDAPR